MVPIKQREEAQVFASKFLQTRRVLRWLLRTFKVYAQDREERAIRLLEEVMELAQAEGVTKEQAYDLLYQVYNKPPGDVHQELGGVMVTLSAYVAVTDAKAGEALEVELTRCESPDVRKRIQEKHEKKLVVSSKIRR